MTTNQIDDAIKNIQREVIISRVWGSLSLGPGRRGSNDNWKPKHDIRELKQVVAALIHNNQHVANMDGVSIKIKEAVPPKVKTSMSIQ